MSDRDLTVLAIFGGLLLAAMICSAKMGRLPVETVAVKAATTAAERSPSNLGIRETLSDRPEQQMPMQRAERPPQLRICFNCASSREMQLLPGVGVRLANELTAFRDANFPVENPEELLAVTGIGPARLKEITPYLDFAIELESGLTDSAATQDDADPLP